MIRFLLNDRPVTLDQIEPSLSVLQYLRTNLGLTGTKEGCAAGDCGACTVVVGELQDGGVHYQAINSCITPLASLHGKQLLTVEHLAGEGGLHPVQQAMVECHGSQCGFCTPGVVMSLFSWWNGVKSGTCTGDRQSVAQALSGNLCRCTGYEPIFRAAERSVAAPTASIDPQPLSALKSFNASDDGNISSGSAHFFSPTSSAELARLLVNWPDARLIAGGTDIGLEFTQQLKTPAVLISTERVAEMQVMEEGDELLRIGGAVTYTRMRPLLERHLPPFAQLLDRLGSLQIRNRGTLGGNIANASPVGDTAPVLLTLGAQLNLRGPSGTRSLPVEQFFTGYRTTALRPGEFIESIDLPKLRAGELLKAYKISKRFDDDISAACLALWLKLDGARIVDARIACGGMAATPARAPQTEAALRGLPFDEDTVRQAQQALARDFHPLDDLRASAAYRLAVAGNLLQRAWLEWQLPGVPNDVLAEFYHA